MKTNQPAEQIEAIILDAKIQLLREIHATALDQFRKDRNMRKSVNDFTGDLLRLRETELTKQQFDLQKENL